ncbi:hypothetical protein GCM10017691_57070 [Pseudonocardia petroleophila]|uniref:Uncharacterized protein n=1 Tax=Pseudonocardia petroleophila TaxID=37331 RepID=A0A7G7MN84_9PSEU|nr:hypothetical protein [Pseudonocardia petroleophila]QNG54245.1 hypothetical protein H6H00_10300 [Pseudonocardia petroleophila]
MTEPLRSDVDAAAGTAVILGGVYREVCLRVLQRFLEDGEAVVRIVSFGTMLAVKGLLMLTDRRLVVMPVHPFSGRVPDVYTTIDPAVVERVSWVPGTMFGRLELIGPGFVHSFGSIDIQAGTELAAELPGGGRPVAADSGTPAPGRAFEIHALGPSGSGKTVLMASLYQRLRLRRPELAFYLRSDPDTSLHLNAVFNRIVDPDQEWPEASQGIEAWNFSACVPSPAGDFEPVSFRYLDYPGGVLTDPRGAHDATISGLVSSLRSANALLILLDGQAMLSLVEGSQRGRRYLDFEITSSLEIAQQSRCPVHFVVTKWDLVEGRCTLDDIRDALLRDENVGDLVRSKAEDAPTTIRLIPVSAVGPGFAELLPDGQMRKIGAPARPQRVELPLLAVVPDFLQFAYAEIEDRDRRLARDADSAAGPGRSWSPLVNRVAELSVPTLRGAIVKRYPALGQVLSEDVFHQALGYADRLAERRADRLAAGRERYAQELQKQRQDVDGDRSALELLESQCENAVTAFEEEQPASVLAGGAQRFGSYVAAARSGG